MEEHGYKLEAHTTRRYHPSSLNLSGTIALISSQRALRDLELELDVDMVRAVTSRADLSILDLKPTCETDAVGLDHGNRCTLRAERAGLQRQQQKAAESGGEGFD